MKRLLAGLLMLCIFSSPLSCLADDYGPESLQCNLGTISIGAIKPEVLSSCGTPTAKSLGPNLTETWTYNFGPTDFIYSLSFEGEQLTKIMRGERGY